MIDVNFGNNDFGLILLGRKYIVVLITIMSNRKLSYMHKKRVEEKDIKRNAISGNFSMLCPLPLSVSLLWGTTETATHILEV